jgi:segregation and condensation protein B
MKPSLSQSIHALLFTTGETWKFSELARTFSVSMSEIESTLSDLKFDTEHQAVVPLIYNETVTLITRPELKDFLQSLEDLENVKEFSKGSLETLALIAYKGPLSKSDIDYIRGVNSQFMLRNLVMRGMIEKQPASKDRSTGYSITVDALRFLGVTSPDQLPHFNNFYEEISKRVSTETDKELLESVE